MATADLDEIKDGEGESVFDQEEAEPSQSSTFEYNPKKVIKDLQKASKWIPNEKQWNSNFCRKALENYHAHLRLRLENPTFKKNKDGQYARQLYTSDNIAQLAIKTLLKTKMHTSQLSQQVRSLERSIGSLRQIPLTDALSYRLLEANGKAGNIGRALSLLEIRKRRGFPPQTMEFRWAIQSLESAALHLRTWGQNVYLGSGKTEMTLENPTRFLDSILIHMQDRGVQLDIKTANKMLSCYACTGRTGNALHFFYQLKKDYVGEGGPLGNEGELPQDDNGAFRLRMKMNHPPHAYKVPGQFMKEKRGRNHISNIMESKKDYCLPLTAAFAFADSLTHGACGHQPIILDIVSYNTLIKACCYRGALFRALQMLNEVLPRKKLKPNATTYNTILAGLARVGDRSYIKDLLIQMTNDGVKMDAFTVQAVVDGYLNLGDVSGAVTWVQDIFNQHRVLPPYTTHLKVLEFALANQQVFEAKRHIYFIQQLWKWDEGRFAGDDDKLKKVIGMTRTHRKLGKDALKKMFSFYGEVLTDDDFF